jgi:hypothetical protein
MRPSLTLPIPALIAALVLPLAACNKAPEVSATNATQKEVGQKVAAATAGSGGVMVQPGRWEGTYTMHEIEMPGLPPQAATAMKAQMGAGHSFVNCVTPEDVKAEKVFYTGDDDKSCKYDHFTLGGGKLDATLTCNRARQGKMAMTMTGSYSPEAYHMDMAAKMEGAPGPAGAMTMKMSVEAKRVGACRGTKDEL